MSFKEICLPLISFELAEICTMPASSPRISWAISLVKAIGSKTQPPLHSRLADNNLKFQRQRPAGLLSYFPALQGILYSYHRTDDLLFHESAG